MAKRFSDTDKWKKSFFRGLEAPYKLLWMYILDDCDIAGVWQVDIEVASIRIGEKLDLKRALELFEDRVTPFDHGKKWFISDFIFFQYGDLSTANRMHQAVIKILKANNLDFPIEPKVKHGASEGLPSPQGQGYIQGQGQSYGQGQEVREEILEIGNKSENWIGIKPKYAGEKPRRVYDLAAYFTTTSQLPALQQNGWSKKFGEFMKANPANVYDDDSHLYNSFKRFCMVGPSTNKTNGNLVDLTNL
jgi:hypothetical protein